MPSSSGAGRRFCRWRHAALCRRTRGLRRATTHPKANKPTRGAKGPTRLWTRPRTCDPDYYSPWWLVSKDREAEREVLKVMYPDGYDVDVIARKIWETNEKESIAEHAVGW